jgi:hypothetical protein
LGRTPAPKLEEITVKIATTTAGLLIAAATLSPATAQVAYTNSALLGCYAHQSTSVDTERGAENRDLVGTFCFDGNGNILGSASTPGLSGHISNTNGMIKTGSDETGTYSITNTPGDGMGTLTIGCTTQAFVIRNVDKTGLAHGLSYILVKRDPKCSGGPEVIGGGAEYQGPLQ